MNEFAALTFHARTTMRPGIRPKYAQGLCTPFTSFACRQKKRGAKRPALRLQDFAYAVMMNGLLLEVLVVLGVELPMTNGLLAVLELVLGAVLGRVAVVVTSD